MSIPTKALSLENRSIGRTGESTLGQAYEILAAAWQSCSCDRELGLHLMFLAWYLLCEPPHITGLHESELQPAALSDVFGEVHEFFEPTIHNDAEMLYVVGLMAHLFPFLLGNEAEFTALSQKYRERYRSLAPDGISPAVFTGRGAYGDYFAGQSKIEGGF